MRMRVAAKCVLGVLLVCAASGPVLAAWTTDGEYWMTENGVESVTLSPSSCSGLSGTANGLLGSAFTSAQFIGCSYGMHTSHTATARVECFGHFIFETDDPEVDEPGDATTSADGSHSWTFSDNGLVSATVYGEFILTCPAGVGTSSYSASYNLGNQGSSPTSIEQDETADDIVDEDIARCALVAEAALVADGGGIPPPGTGSVTSQVNVTDFTASVE